MGIFFKNTNFYKNSQSRIIPHRIWNNYSRRGISARQNRKVRSELDRLIKNERGIFLPARWKLHKCRGSRVARRIKVKDANTSSPKRKQSSFLERKNLPSFLVTCVRLKTSMISIITPVSIQRNAYVIH